MFQTIFRNMGPAIKNILIINVLMFLAKVVLENQGVNLGQILGMFYPSSPFFRIWQPLTHVFMHANFNHLFFNMLSLLFLGIHLENYWGTKRFLIYYFVTAFGAAFLHFGIQGVEIYSATGSFFPSLPVNFDAYTGMIEYLPTVPNSKFVALIYVTPTVGASGALYGLIMAYAYLFPNTEFLLYFAIPVKAKWLALGLGVYALYSGWANNAGDSVAHFAHLGGMIFGFILLKFWQKKLTQFY
ncbi:MAG TPA: rhomboid family intramembrane serine protease [Crocinitomix sp.]|nr:rhomboid family intramembrane serine protease [Crocinitomix sp.]